ncbi:hypothetical protein P153DRAFT_399387 [Dothidotthia symphoricarpi CBS 119687]|uniref:Extracellular membrane protein CFEM domain-containing protein n=1 Tax=Dothidotthia symphoricarpi CBS 119687 TaxID=1392245 RepID=A0A6A6A6D1_9PLEO|nr:uncharacterized protein P153DRAFT_399387 [Dothidotthia symphoricarpi CBS 119687]KAF2126624.1 hypothetical protein P153DRAFT_399387 [Dothidotthia symphoricarpi CBS 119687]
MFLSHFLSLCFMTSTLIAASSPTTAPFAQRSLPDALQQIVPACAQSCLQKSLADNFPIACTVPGNIGCLCSHYSSSGETLGEVAFSCVFKYCASDKQDEASSYNICLGREDAVLPTKTAFTIVVGSTSSTKTMSPSTTRSSSGSAITPAITSIAPTTLQTQTSSSQQPVVVDSISLTPSATSTTSSTAAPTAVTVEESRKMTPAQIAGLSVAGVAAFVFAVGLMALSVCLRRRRERKYEQLSDEKSQGHSEKRSSTRFSHYVPLGSVPEPPKQFSLLPPPAAHTAGQTTRSDGSPFNGRPANGMSVRPVQRLGVGTSPNSSDSSLPLDQIGLAISAEMDGKPAAPQPKAAARQQRPKSIQTERVIPSRPSSTMTQNTVFEEDEVMARRRSSTLLPTPPIPIPPIRRLQPSRPLSKLNTTTPAPQLNTHRRKASRGSELFLDLPIRHERPQPRNVTARINPSNGSPAPRPTPQIRLAPPMETHSSSSTIQTSTPSTNTPVSGTPGDIPDYYFSAPSPSPPHASPAQFTKPKLSPRTVQIKAKKSMSTVSSHASTARLRDSLSSQTSFESADRDDPTPEDEDDDKQLSSSDDNSNINNITKNTNKPSKNTTLPPVPELGSPLAKLRYPKVPRASNQCVPRSPKTTTTPTTTMLGSANRTRNNDLASPRRRAQKQTLHLHLQTQQPHPHRKHTRSSSETHTPSSPRQYNRTRPQSVAWPSSPIERERGTVVKPLNVRRGVWGAEREGLKIRNTHRDGDGGVREEVGSPVWVPRLTPTRKGDDLMISVGWGV